MASFDPHDWCARCREKVIFFLPFLTGPDQVLEDRQDFRMKSPLENSYGESNLECEPLFSTTSGAPAGSAAGPEVDDRKISVRENWLLVLIQNCHRIRTIFKLRTSLIERQYEVLDLTWGGTLSQTLSLLLQVLLTTPGLEVTLNQWERFLLLSLLKNGFAKNLKI